MFDAILPAPARLRVLVDVDTGIDDALALVFLARVLAAGGLDLWVSTSAGNCSARQAAVNSAAVLGACGVRVPVRAGLARPWEVDLVTTPETHGPDGLGYFRVDPGSVVQADPAVFWGEAAPDLLLVCGPATNVARVVERRPELLRRCQVVIMGGAFDYPGNTTATAEWNAWVDPHALDFALRNFPAGAPLPVVVPLNVTEQVVLRPERLAGWLARWEAAGEGRLAGLVGEALRFYFEFHESVGVGYCAQIHDLAAALVMLGMVDFRAVPAAVRVDVEGAARGTTRVVAGAPPNARIVTELGGGLGGEAVFREFERVVFRGAR